MDQTNNEVTYLKTISKEALHNDFIRQNKIVVLTDVTKNWPISEWSFSNIKQKYGSFEVRVRGGDRLNWRNLFRTSLKNYIEFILNEKSANINKFAKWQHMNPYAAFNVISAIHDEVFFKKLVPNNYSFYPDVLWVGPKHSLTPLHFDASGHTFFAQIIGRKHFKLFHYDQSKYLYPSDIFDFMSVFSEVNIDEPDLNRHNKYLKAKSIDLILNPGELIVIPIRVWHQVKALDISVSICSRGLAHNFSSKLEHLGWYFKAACHLLGLYKNRRCLCHIDPWTDKDLEIHTSIVKFLANLKLCKIHGLDLSDLLHWRDANYHER